MSDNAWRMKTYYRPRILLELADLTDTPLGDVLICLTGADRGILQNLLAYAHRRSTWVSEYNPTYYLAPDEEEWDVIEAAVAELEDKLMGCPELEQLLEDIKAAAQCACDQLTAMPKEGWPAGGIHDGQPDYDDYTSPVEYDVGDPPEGFADWEEWQEYVCKAAQHVIDDAYDLSAKLELLYTTGAAITFSAFQALIIGSAVAPPVALVLAIVELLLVLGTALSMNAVEEWIWDHKQALTCAIYWGGTVGGAKAAIAQVVDEYWDLAMSPPFLYYILSDKVLSSIYDGTVADYEEWESEYSATYCAACMEPQPLPAYAEWEFPPCPGDWTPQGPSAVCQSGTTPRVDSNTSWFYSPTFGPYGAGQVEFAVRAYMWIDPIKNHELTIRIQVDDGAGFSDSDQVRGERGDAWFWADWTGDPMIINATPTRIYRLKWSSQDVNFGGLLGAVECGVTRV